MKIGVPSEVKNNEHRVGLTPESVKILTDLGHELFVQSNAGYEIGFLGDVEILHKESSTVGRLSALKIEYMFRNRILFARRRNTSYTYITVLYLLSFVLLRDTLDYVLKGKFSLLVPLYRGAMRGVIHPVV